MAYHIGCHLGGGIDPLPGFRVDDDPESLALAERLAADDAPTVVTEVMGIDEGHPLRSALVDIVAAAQADPAV